MNNYIPEEYKCAQEIAEILTKYGFSVHISKKILKQVKEKMESCSPVFRSGSSDPRNQDYTWEI